MLRIVSARGQPQPGDGGLLRQGFTLIEVAIAVAIIAIALMAVLKSGLSSTQALEGLRDRLLADWVAINRLEQHRSVEAWLPLGNDQGTVVQGGVQFRWQEEVSTTPNPKFRRLDIRVFHEEGAHALAELSGLVVETQ